MLKSMVPTTLALPSTSLRPMGVTVLVKAHMRTHAQAGALVKLVHWCKEAIAANASAEHSSFSFVQLWMLVS